MSKNYKGGNIKKSKTPLNKSEEHKNTEEYKLKIQNNSYLGNKGYTIIKAYLDPIDLQFLYKDLVLVPFVEGGCNTTSPPVMIPVYRENAKKIYIPRFYGIDRYGYPVKSELGEKIERIDVTFTKPLRDYQETVVNMYMDHIQNKNIPHKFGGGGILSLYTGAGKTVCAIKIISLIGLKTLIIVHKEFLLNQWTERIMEFMPNAKIGRIQGSKMDVENKDIVIAMMQTLYNEEKTFSMDTFGLCIVDEVHRIASVQYHKALFQFQTLYYLGISATVERKDTMDKLLYMFLGKIIYSMERKGDDVVSVRGIEYISKDDEYNDVILDYKGDILYSSMVSKVCQFKPRSDFIIRVLKDLIQESPYSQILVLGHLRAILEYLYEKLLQENISTGFYVGKMKQFELDETALTKQIVLSTYMMSSEALDIPTLSTLVFISPKTDIIQCVGRILRKKHEKTIIVDIIDPHTVFQNQWNKRRIYYKKCNYQIQHTNTLKYQNMLEMTNTNIWKTLYNGVLKTENNETNDKYKCIIDCSEFNTAV
jgi:superfamily II DNA or RNA helicase